MTIMLSLLTGSVLLLIASGIYLEIYPLRPAAKQAGRFKKVIGSQLVLSVIGVTVMLFVGIQDVLAQPQLAQSGKDISIGMGLALIGIGLPTALATIGAGIAVSSVGAAALAVITEKPEVFGRTLIYLGLAEGIAIYGLVVTILLLGKI